MTIAPRHLAELVVLAAIWGGSFLFMRLGAADFGPLPLAFLRGAGGTALLLPLLLWRDEWSALRQHWRPIALVGLTNSAIPFLCFAYAALALNAGLSAIFNATTPLWGAAIAWAWLGDRLTVARCAGLGLGFIGVAWLAYDQAGLRANTHGISPGSAALACLLATVLYGYSASFTRRRLSGLPAMALATGSQLSTACALALPALWQWPTAGPSNSAWGAAIALSLLCTGVAYVLYFRLLERIGAASTMSVTYLIPMFAMAWGALVLHEQPSRSVMGAGTVILLGTALTTGLWPRRSTRP